MGFSDNDQTIQKDVAIAALSWRCERNEGYAEEPKVDIFVVIQTNGNTEHRQVPRGGVVANWDGPSKTLDEWTDLAILAVL